MSRSSWEPGVRGGRACIDETRIAVVDIVALLTAGKSAEEMLLAYPSLNLAQVSRSDLLLLREHPRDRSCARRGQRLGRGARAPEAEYLRTAK